MFHQTFLSPQVKRCMIITSKHGIYELLYKSPNELRLMIIGNQEKSGKCVNSPEKYHTVQSSFQNENFINPSKNPLKNSN